MIKHKKFTLSGGYSPTTMGGYVILHHHAENGAVIQQIKADYILDPENPTKSTIEGIVTAMEQIINDAFDVVGEEEDFDPTF